MTAKVKQKTLNSNTTTPLITYCSSSTSTPPSAPASCPSSSSPVRPFIITASGNFQKIGKKWAIICIASTWFCDSEQKLFLHSKANRGFVLDSELKLRYIDNLFGLTVVLKKWNI